MNRRGVVATGLAGMGAALIPSASAHAAADGLSREGLARLDDHYRASAERGERAGYVVAVGRHGKRAHLQAYGAADLASGAPMRSDALFRIASLTKLVTSVAALQIVESGRLQLGDPVGRYLPEIGAMQVAMSPDKPDEVRPPARPMTVRDLMLHMSGIGYRSDAATALGRRYQAANLFQRKLTLEGAIKVLAELPLYADPGERVIYSYSTDVLGRLVEVVSGEPLERRLQRTIFEPLGMADTTFHLAGDRRGDLATAYRAENASLVPAEEEVFGNPFDTNRWTSGGAGLISTAPDYLRFLMALERRGALGRARVLSPATVDLLARNHLSPAVLARLAATPLAGLGFGLGSAVVVDAGQAVGQFRDGDYFWSGHYDTQYFVSPSTGLAAVVMTQLRETPGAPPSRTAADFRALVYGALAS